MVVSDIVNIIWGVLGYSRTAFDLHSYSQILMCVSLFPNAAISEHINMYYFVVKFFLFVQIASVALNVKQGCALVLASVLCAIILSCVTSGLRWLLKPHIQVVSQKTRDNQIIRRDVYINYQPRFPTCTKVQKELTQEVIHWVLSFSYNYKVVSLTMHAAVLSISGSSVFMPVYLRSHVELVLGDYYDNILLHVGILTFIMVILAALLSYILLRFRIELSHNFNTYYHIDANQINGIDLPWYCKCVFFILGLPLCTTKINAGDQHKYVNVEIRAIHSSQDTEKVPVQGYLYLDKHSDRQCPEKLMIHIKGCCTESVLSVQGIWTCHPLSLMVQHRSGNDGISFSGPSRVESLSSLSSLPSFGLSQLTNTTPSEMYYPNAHDRNPDAEDGESNGGSYQSSHTEFPVGIEEFPPEEEIIQSLPQDTQLESYDRN